MVNTKERREYDKHKSARRSGGADGKRVGKAPYQFLAIYEIVSIKRVYGGMNTTDSSAATGAAATPDTETAPRVVAGQADDAGLDGEEAGGEEEKEEEEEETVT